MRKPLVVHAIALLLPMTTACAFLDTDDETTSPGAPGSPSGAGSRTSPPTAPSPPTEFRCGVSGHAKLAVETAPQHAALTLETGAPPIVTAMEPTAPLWGAVAAIKGNGLGNGDGGEYVTFGSGVNEKRLDACPPSTSSATSREWAYLDGTCASFTSYASSVSFIVPLGASGDVVLHTKHGNATAGSVGATWRSSAVHHAAGRARVLASLETSGATYALVVDDGTASTAAGTTGGGKAPTLLRFTDGAVSSVKLEALGAVEASTTAAFAERADGGVDLGVAVTASSGTYATQLRFVHVMPDGVDVEMEEACVPSSFGPLVMRRGAAGTVAWTYLSATGGGRIAGVARLVHDADRHVWKIDRGPMPGPATGLGVERDDGSVLLAWGAPMGGLFDAKAQARIARLAPDGTAFREDNLHDVLDDYVHVDVLVTSAGSVVSHCSSDSTGFFDDTGAHGAHCHAVQIDASGARGALPGYPETFDASWALGVVADRVVALRTTATVGYYATPTDAPSAIAGPKATAAFVSMPAGASAEPTVMLATPGALAVARPR